MKQVPIDPMVFTALLSVASFLLLSLLGIITYLAKGLDKKVGDIKTRQEADSITIKALAMSIEFLTTELKATREGLAELPKLQQLTLSNTKDIQALFKLIEEYRGMMVEQSSTIKDMSKWIRELESKQK